jgi:hypothetical protein
MKTTLLGLMLLAVAFGTPQATATSLDNYLDPISGPAMAHTPQEMATRDVLQLNQSMFTLYERAQKQFRKNILAKHPVIIAQFSSSGGRMILYRPDRPPEEAPSVPVRYQVMKSLGHSTLAILEVVLPHMGHPGDKSWMASLQTYLTELKIAREGIGLADMPGEWQLNSRTILDGNIGFIEECLAYGEITRERVQGFAKAQAPYLRKAIAWAAQTQVTHWMTVLDRWQVDLGGSFRDTFGATNTIYVARQNNVLFSVLAQYFGPDAINERLLLIETISFTTTPDEMLTALVRIISDRTVGGLFFNNYRLMDYELMGTDARKTIIAEMKARGLEAFLPPEVPYGSKQWPALIIGEPGPASLDDLD